MFFYFTKLMKDAYIETGEGSQDLYTICEAVPTQ